ncbi:MAG: tetratricopeptide repeat protein [Spirulina sp. SIO3F2]|nr:tetratricopeptide repeat protein [Spirulina sp. SIO3F2]
MNDRATPPATDFVTLFQAAQQAFERGQYQNSITLLEAAGKQVLPASRQGGEVKLWLVNAYQALGEAETAIALCEALLTHPFVSKKARDLMYILKAPVLERPKEWLTEIPDLQRLEESAGRDRYASAPAKSTPRPTQSAPLDPTEINHQDNQFVWVAIGILLLVCGGVVWFF